ncbi:MAG: hypothetical protein ABI460_00975 [Caldimonas sp.]
MTAMDFNVTREQWVERFAARMSVLQVGSEPNSFLETGEKLWPTRGQFAPEAAAEAEATLRRNRATAPSERYEDSERFERTERIPVERIHTAEEYVRDSDAWIARCVARVLQLDPIIKADEANRSVTELAQLERWRLMKPESAAEQLYTPIKVKPS